MNATDHISQAEGVASGPSNTSPLPDGVAFADVPVQHSKKPHSVIHNCTIKIRVLTKFARTITQSAWYEKLLLAVMISNSIISGVFLEQQLKVEIELTLAFIIFYWVDFLLIVLSAVHDMSLHDLLYWPRLIKLSILVFATAVDCLHPGDGLYILVFTPAVSLLRMTKALSRLPTLRFFVSAILLSIQSVFQFAAVLFFFIYPSAVVATRFIGMSTRFSDASTDEGALNRDLWGSLFKSSVTLFQMSTLDWGDIARASMKVEPWLFLPYLFFILVTGFSVVNIFITIIGEQYVELREQQKLRDAEYEEDMRKIHLGEQMTKAQPERIQQLRQLLDDIAAQKLQPEDLYSHEVSRELSNTDLAYIMMVRLRAQLFVGKDFDHRPNSESEGVTTSGCNADFNDVDHNQT